MSFPIEIEAAALVRTLSRIEPDVTAEQVDDLSLLSRLLIAGVENATDAHWVLVRKMLLVDADTEEATCP